MKSKQPSDEALVSIDVVCSDAPLCDLEDLFDIELASSSYSKGDVRGKRIMDYSMARFELGSCNVNDLNQTVSNYLAAIIDRGIINNFKSELIDSVSLNVGIFSMGPTTTVSLCPIVIGYLDKLGMNVIISYYSDLWE